MVVRIALNEIGETLGHGYYSTPIIAPPLKLQLAEILRGPIVSFLYLSMLAFEVPLGFWLLIKGVRGPDKDNAAIVKDVLERQ